MGAPVCVIQPTEPIQVPKGQQLPPIPIATNLLSAIQAINAMRQLIIVMLGQISPNGQPTPGGGFSSNLPPDPKKANFKEVRAARQTTTMRIYDPTNRNNYVDVQQITGLTFIDPLTSQTINWQQ